MRLTFFFSSLLLSPFFLYSQITTYTLASPNSALRLSVETKPSLTWQLNLRDQPLTVAAPMSMTLAHFGTLGANPEVATRNLDIIKKYKPRAASMVKAYCK